MCNLVIVTLALAVGWEVPAKPLSRECECPLVKVPTKGITADHKNWIEQRSKQDSYLIRRILFAFA